MYVTYKDPNGSPIVISVDGVLNSARHFIGIDTRDKTLYALADDIDAGKISCSHVRNFNLGNQHINVEVSEDVKLITIHKDNQYFIAGNPTKLEYRVLEFVPSHDPAGRCNIPFWKTVSDFPADFYSKWRNISEYTNLDQEVIKAMGKSFKPLAELSACEDLPFDLLKGGLTISCCVGMVDQLCAANNAMTQSRIHYSRLNSSQIYYKQYGSSVVKVISHADIATLTDIKVDSGGARVELKPDVEWVAEVNKFCINFHRNGVSTIEEAIAKDVPAIFLNYIDLDMEKFVDVINANVGNVEKPVSIEHAVWDVGLLSGSSRDVTNIFTYKDKISFVTQGRLTQHELNMEYSLTYSLVKLINDNPELSDRLTDAGKAFVKGWGAEPDFY